MEKSIQKTDEQKTRKKILLTASKIFAEKGYKETTIRMIAKKADVNIALINYYFGNKEALYLEIIQYWADAAFKDFPNKEISDKTISPEKRLKIFINSTLLCLMGKNGKGTGFARLITWEASQEPSKVVSEVVAKSIGMPTENLFDIVEEITGICSKEEIRLLSACIIGQTVYFYLSRNLIKDLFHIESNFSQNDMQNITETIYRFTIASLENIKK